MVEALEAVGGRSMSSVANDALREALELAAHRVALREWLDELDVKHGAPSPEQFAAATRGSANQDAADRRAVRQASRRDPA